MLYPVWKIAQAIGQHFGRSEEGATAVEYGVMVALIIAVIIAVVATIGQELIPGLETVNNGLST